MGKAKMIAIFCRRLQIRSTYQAINSVDLKVAVNSVIGYDFVISSFTSQNQIINLLTSDVYVNTRIPGRDSLNRKRKTPGLRLDRSRLSALDLEIKP